MAITMCAGVVFALTVYSCTTKSDLTYCVGIVFVVAMIMMMISMFYLFSFFHVRSRFLRIVIAICGVILMSVYLIFDIQLVMGGKY